MILSERNQTQNDSIYMKYSEYIIHRDTMQIGGCQGLRGKEQLPNGHAVSLWSNNVLELDIGGGCTVLWMY